MAVNWNDYQPTDWSPGMPITEGRMDHLEQGVTDNRDDVQELNNILNGTEGLVNKVNTITSGIGTNAVSDYANKTLWQAIASLYNTTNIEGQAQKINQGAEAYTQIVAAVGGYDELGNLKKSLSQRLEGMEQQEANDISGILDTLGRANNVSVFDSTNTVSKAITDLKNILGKNADNTAYYFDDNQNTVAIKMRDLIRRMGDAETELFANSISGTTYASLSDRLTGITNSLQALGGTNGAVPLIQQELNNAHESSVITVDQGGTQVNKTYDSIDARFEDIESRAETLNETVGEKINVSAIRNALNVTETGTVLDGRVGKTIRDMLYNVTTETAFTASDTVAGRIAAAVSDISTLQGAVGETALVSNVVKEEVEGQEVNKQYDDIGERFTDIETHAADMQDNLNDINAELEAAHESSVIKEQVEDEETHEITEVNKQYDSIDSRFEAIETHKKAIADEIEAAHTSTIIRTEVPAAEEGQDPTYTDTTYNSLDARLEAIEAHAAAARNDVNTIAEELGMMTQAGAIEDTNTKVDRLNDNVLALGKEIGMLSDETTLLPLATEINRESTRIDTIDADLNTATTGIKARLNTAETNINNLQEDLDTATTGVKARITALETNVNDATSGLAATKAIADQNASDINGTNGLKARITILETAPKSATVIINKEKIIYDNNGVPTVYTENYIENGTNTPIIPNKDVDYLFETQVGNEIKYYYWKYINNQWEKISGDGGSGTGSSNAEDYETHAAFVAATPELNKDYYVLEADGIRHHYRYLNVEESPIEIDDYSNNIKRYNVEKIVVDEKTYLRLFEYNYDDVNAIDDDIVEVKSWEHSTNYVKDQLVLYQTYIYKCVPDSTNDEEWIPEKWALASDIRILNTIELPEGGGEATAAYRIYAKNLQDQAQRFSLQDATTGDGITLSYAYTCYAMEMGNPDYKAAIYELRTSDGTLVASSNTTVDYLTIDDYNNNVANLVFRHMERFCNTNEQTTFILTLTIPNEADIRQRIVTSYVTIVDLQLKSTFSDLNTYPIGNISIPYQFIGMSDQTPVFTVTLDGSTINAGITNTNIVIREAQLAGRSGVHNVSIVASQTIGGSPIYSNRLNYQLGIEGGSDIMLFSGLSLGTQYAEQYKILKLPYYLYIPDGSKRTVSYTAEQVYYNDQNEITSTHSVDALNRPSESFGTGEHEYSFRIYEMIDDTEYYRITISCENKTLIFNVTTTKAAEEINIKKGHLVFDFKPERFTNNVQNEADRLWHYENGDITYKMRIPDGAHFDWRTGGWITTTDSNNNDIPCFCVKAGSRVEFIQDNDGTISPLTLFWNGMETLGGSDFKCTFKIDNVKTPNAPFLTSLDGEPKTIINYGKTILSEKQDVEDDDTLLYKYINTKYIYTETVNNKNKVIKEAISNTVINNEPFSNYVTTALRDAASTSARNKNKKKIKQYISNIYDIANQASNQTHREYLLKVLSGKENSETIDYNTIKDEIIDYLFDEDNYDAIVLTNPDTNNPINQTAQDVYNRLVEEEADSSTITYAYRQVEPVNFDALLNGFIVEGKDGKDGIIAMILFTFRSTIKVDGGFVQTISAEAISTNSFAGTETFRAYVTNAAEETKEYEVEIYKENDAYTEIKSIRDASNKESRAYGLELNALGSNIYLPSGVVSYAHSEGDIIEFEYNINPEITGRINSSIIIYEDGVPSAAKLYATNNNIFEQESPGCLTIGSDDCDVYIYKMRLYDQSLSNEDILSNFYADGLTVDEMTDRYNRNKALSKAEVITPQLVATECPDLRVIMIEAPNLTGGKTSFIKNSKIRCIYKNGRPEDNWVALNAYHAGQGTSSDNYGASGRNLDIIFGFDGKDTVIVPKPQKNNYTFDPNYKSIIIKGLDDDDTNDILTAEEYEAAGYDIYYNDTNKEPGTVSLTSTSVPNNWFNIKVNVASSENTNNAFLQKRFDRYLPYTTPAKIRDPRIKNDMEFFNCVIFIKETGTPSEFTDDKNIDAAARPWHFYGIGNIGDSKKTDKTRVNVEQDPYEYCIEITDNGLKLSGFYSGVFYISNDSATRDKNATKYKLDELQLMIDTELAREQVNTSYVNTLRSYLPESAAFSKTIAHICSSEEYSANGTAGEYTININVASMNTEEREAVDDTLYLIPVVGNNFTYYYRYIYYDNTWQKIGEPITFTRTSYGIKYPISTAEWTCELNNYYSTLYDLTSGKGWDKSFEFRYDITTKDGETVARNDLEEAMNTLHQTANKKSFADMYSWLVTCSNSQFNRDLGQQFIKNSPLYWYLFTERYTMIDSRAKNTFYHYGKVYISQYEYEGNVLNDLNNITPTEYLAAHPEIKATAKVAALDIAEAEINFKKVAAEFIYQYRDTFTKDDTQAAINDGYRFELWDYDNDTALGINNNGQMVFSAGLEDIDKDVSGWIYNEAESVMWRRIRENMYADLGALYVQLKGNGCFNAENLIQEFDRMQSQFPEELWRLDFVRKYYRPFKDAGETTYLNDMANGRKRYQRRQFERNMAIYINSKYQRNGSYNENDIISFRPQFTWSAGRDTQIIIKPYSTMYINFALGNYDNTDEVTINTTVSTRIERGQTYIINAADYIHDFNNIQCIIYNASRIMSLEGLGNFECKQFILGAAKKLSVLKLGSTTYENRSMAEITNMGLSDGLPLLEELDLTNIVFTNSPAVFSLENFPLLKRLNATGCNIRSFIFKDGGMLENIIFPSVLTNINFNNLYNLVDTYEDEELVRAVTLTGATNLTSYNSNNSYSNSYEIVTNMINNAGINGITSLKLNDINWTIGNMIELEPLIQLQKKLGIEMLLKGTITVTGNWSQVKKDDYDNTFGAKNINWILDDDKKKPEYKLSFYLDAADVGDETKEYYRCYASQQEGAVNIVLGDDPVYIGDCPVPTKTPTISKTYYFGTNKNTYIPWTGWRISGSAELPYEEKSIQDNIDFIAIFGEESRTYPLLWYLNKGDTNYVGSASNIPYGSSYEGLAPSIYDLKKNNKTTYTFNSTDGINCTYKIFKGWEKAPINLDETFLNDEKTAFCIYGAWDTGTNVPINDLKTMIPTNNEDLAKKLLALTNISNASATMPIGNTIEVEMGHDHDGGTTIIGKNASITFGSGLAQTTYDENNILQFTYYYNNNNQLSMSPSILQAPTIKPFEDMTNRGFTLAIDYQIDPDYISKIYNNGYSIICGCYSGEQNGSASGFALYYDVASGYPKIIFGNLGEQVNYTDGNIQNLGVASQLSAKQRNIVVIRHKAGSDKLQIYSGINVNGSFMNLKDNNYEREITWSINAFNAPLCFGHFTRNVFNSVSNVRQGIGTKVYWAKYWDEDLGKDECIRISSWAHEKLTFALEDYSSDANQDVIKTTANNMIFSALSLSQYGGPQVQGYDNSTYHTSTVTGTRVVWGYELDNTGNSLYKKIANERFFSGLPKELQSVIEKTPSSAMLAELYHTVSGNYYQVSSNVNTVDLAFIPSYIEVGGLDPHEIYAEEALRSMPIRQAANCTVYTYDNGFDLSSPGSSANYMNLRFFGKPIKTSGNVVYDQYNSDAPAFATIATSISQQNEEIHSGDILIYKKTVDNNTEINAYIYATAAEVAAGAPIIRADSGTTLYCESGGWIKADAWWTRSVSAILSSEYYSTRATNQPFYYVQGHSGEVVDKNIPNNSNGAYFVYSFGV